MYDKMLAVLTLWSLTWTIAASVDVPTANGQYDSVARGGLPLANSEENLRISCVGRTDGSYPLSSCSESYAMCRAEKATQMQCSKGLVFNADSLQCDFREHVAECRDAFDCVGRSDGVYSVGCSEIFWYCSNGIVSLSRCPASLYFDISSLRCEYKKLVSACNDASTTASAVGPSSPSPSASGDKMRSGVFRIGLTAAPFFNTFPTYKTVTDAPAPGIPISHSFADSTPCEGREDGKFELGDCEERSLQCSNGKGIIVKCAAGFVFMKTTQKCTPRNELPECADTGKTTPTSSNSTLPSTTTATTDLPTTTASAMVEERSDCEDRADGPYEMQKCFNKFIMCSNGLTTVTSCPSSLVFSSEAARCEYPTNTMGCAEYVEAEPTVTTAKTTSPSAKDVPAIQVVQDAQCANRGNGAFANGCSEKYVVCSEGIATNMMCQSGLAFNSDGGFCDYKTFVPSCGASVKDSVTVTSAMPSATDTTQKPSLVDENMKCSTNRVGLFSLGCSEKYVACSNGVATMFSCPFQLAFSETSGSCDYKEFVPECGGVARDSTSSSTALLVGDSKQTPPSAEQVSSCPSEGSSTFAEGCSQKFTICTNGSPKEMFCPSGLAFSKEGGFCDFKNYIPACGGVARDTVTTVPSQLTSATVTQATGDARCANRNDGVYSNGCSEGYFACSNEKPVDFTCPGGLVFNEVSGLCDYKELVSACGGATVTVVTSAPAKDLTVKPTALPSKGKSDCESRVDGFYALGCSQSYYGCSNGRTLDFTCPGGLAFNEASVMCDYKEQVPECGGTVGTTAVLVPSALDKPSATPLPSKGEAQCAGREDGVYPMGCSEEYFACTNGRATAFACPGGLIFNGDSGECDFKERVSQCGSMTVTMLTPTPANDQTSVVTGAPSNGGRECANRADGLYALGCSESYFACSNGKLLDFTCPDGLVFNEATATCDYRENIISCEGVAATTATPVTSMDRPSTTAPPFKGDMQCDGREDGVYSMGCSEKYFACSNGISTIFVCPSELVFSVDDGFCEYRGNVPECRDVARDPSTSTPLLPVVTATQPPQQPADELCVGRPNLALSRGCSHEYLMCWSGRLWTMVCPSGLIFNIESRSCARKEFVLACGGTSPETDTATEPGTDEDDDYHVPSTALPHATTFDLPYYVADGFDVPHEFDSQPKGPVNTRYSQFVQHDAFSESSHNQMPPIAYQPLPPFVGPRVNGVPDAFNVESKNVVGGFPFVKPDAPIPKVESPFVSDAHPEPVRDDFRNTQPLHRGFDPFDVPNVHGHVFDGFGAPKNPPFGQPPRWPMPMPDLEHPSTSEATAVVLPDTEPSDEEAEATEAPPTPSESTEAHPAPSESTEAPPAPSESTKAHPMPSESTEASTTTSESTEASTTTSESTEPSTTPSGSTEALPTPSELTEIPPTSSGSTDAPLTPSVSSEAPPTPSQSTEAPPIHSVPTEVSPTPSSSYTIIVSIGEEPTSLPLSRKEKEKAVELMFINEVRQKQHDDLDMRVDLISGADSQDNGSGSAVLESRLKRSISDPSTASVEEATLGDDEEKGASLCRDQAPGTRIAMGFCQQDFVHCNSEGWSSQAVCIDGELFDGSALECVPAEECGRIPKKIPTADPISPAGPAVSTDEPIKACGEKPSTLPPQQDADARCDFVNITAVPLGFCRMDYLLCLRRGIGHTTYCIRGYLFDHTVGRCLPAKECGVHVINSDALPSKITPTMDPMCKGIVDGVPKKVGRCRTQYYVCIQGVPNRKRCLRRSEVFSEEHGKCISRQMSVECTIPSTTMAVPSLTAVILDGHSFCDGKSDGVYRHPGNCSRVIQCFGGDVFEYTPCASGLSYNEISGGCDYNVNVPGCNCDEDGQTIGIPRVTDGALDGCRGHSHGDFIADPSDCSVFYRCVWGRLELMRCPPTTVFNPLLNVCDYPSEVPSCNSPK